MVYFRDIFYRFKSLYGNAGEASLQEMSQKKLIIKNRVSAEIEEGVIAQAIANPAFDQLRASNEPKQRELRSISEVYMGLYICDLCKIQRDYA